MIEGGDMRTAWIIIPFLVLFLIPLQAGAETPLGTVETGVNEVLEILKDPRLQGVGYEKEKKEKIWNVLNEFFDFTELAKRTIGRQWKEITDKEKREFIALYKSVLEDAYMERILAYSDEKIVFDSETKLSDTKVEVMTRVIRRTTEIPIAYRVLKEGDRWMVYDVIIEGVSLTGNYRTQFREILVNGTFEDLLKILREKVGKAH